MKQQSFHLAFSDGYLHIFPEAEEFSKTCTIKLSAFESNYLTQNCEIDKKTGKILRILPPEESFITSPEKSS